MSTVLFSQDNVKQDERQTSANKTGLAFLHCHLQEFDMAIDEALDGLTGAQQLLNQLKAECFSARTGDIAPAAKLKVQRGGHHCARLITEIQMLLQPLSLDLQELHDKKPPYFPQRG